MEKPSFKDALPERMIDARIAKALGWSRLVAKGTPNHPFNKAAGSTYKLVGIPPYAPFKEIEVPKFSRDDAAALALADAFGFAAIQVKSGWVIKTKAWMHEHEYVSRYSEDGVHDLPGTVCELVIKQILDALSGGKS